MRVYLVQHGKAKTKEEDPERPLTDEGRGDVGCVADLVGPRARPRRIINSGKARAEQTAKILARHLGVDTVETMPDLDPMADPGVWSAHLAAMSEDVMLVGHLPHMGRLAGLLLCGDAESNVIEFQMGCVVCMRRSESGQWALDWMITPEIAA